MLSTPLRSAPISASWAPTARPPDELIFGGVTHGPAGEADLPVFDVPLRNLPAAPSCVSALLTGRPLY